MKEYNKTLLTLDISYKYKTNKIAEFEEL